MNVCCVLRCMELREQKKLIDKPSCFCCRCCCWFNLKVNHWNWHLCCTMRTANWYILCSHSNDKQQQYKQQTKCWGSTQTVFAQKPTFILHIFRCRIVLTTHGTVHLHQINDIFLHSIVIVFCDSLFSSCYSLFCLFILRWVRSFKKKWIM